MSRRSGWGSAMEHENAVRRQTLHKSLQQFTNFLLEQVASLPHPDYRRIESTYFAVGWNLIIRRVFVVQHYWWESTMYGDERIATHPGRTLLMSITVGEEPGHVSQLVLPQRTSDIVEGAYTSYSMEPILNELRGIRNTWRPPEVQQLYHRGDGSPISQIFNGLPQLPGAYELVMQSHRRYHLSEGNPQ